MRLCVQYAKSVVQTVSLFPDGAAFRFLATLWTLNSLTPEKNGHGNQNRGPGTLERVSWEPDWFALGGKNWT